MEYLDKSVWDNFTKEELGRLQVKEPDKEGEERVLRNWDALAKPLGAMGRFEYFIARIGAITGTEKIDLSRKAVIIMCADNGVVKEGVSSSGQEVTEAVARIMGKDRSCVGYMAKAIGADIIPVDIGIHSKEGIPGVLCRKVRSGTANFVKEPAMTEEEALRAITTGMEIAFWCKDRGYQILATGELGMGNTTTSSAVAAALLRCEVHKVVGRGAGLDDAGLARKEKIIEGAIRKYELYMADAFTILRSVGGLDIAGLAGVCIGAAMSRLPVVLDGVISMTAALLAQRLVPGTKAYYLPSHQGKEPAVKLLAQELELEPVILADMALGEGTGAVMMFSLLDLVLSIYQGGTILKEIEKEKSEEKF